MDTIFALATARGKAGVAIVRLSGPQSHAVVHALAGDLPQSRRASLRTLRYQGEVLDQAIVLTFIAGESFTGEDSAEFHVHGGQAVAASLLGCLRSFGGLRLALPGEFTRRALENGRLDLSQVEGLADLVDAETEAQRRQAMRVLAGSIGKKAERWRRELIRAGALLEATIDFADEDIPQDVLPEVLALARGLLENLKLEAGGVRYAERLRDGYEVAIVGRPNSGKSTLLNMLSGREAAITSEIAGTTRDIIEVRMDLSGLPVTFLDTAGLRETGDGIERIGIDRAVERSESADLRVFLLDEQGMPGLIEPQSEDIIVMGKGDLREDGCGVSGKTGAGATELLESIETVLTGRLSQSGTLTRERHRIAIERAIEELDRACIELSGEGPRVEIAAELLRAATRSLDSLVGRVDVEAVLGEIFSNFCVGK